MRNLYRANYKISTDGENYTTVQQTDIFYDEHHEPTIKHFTDFDSLRHYVEPRCLGYSDISIFTFKIKGLYLKNGTYIKRKANNINIYYQFSYEKVECATMDELMKKLDSKEFIQYLKDNDITTINQKGLTNINKRK